MSAPAAGPRPGRDVPPGPPTVPPRAPAVLTAAIGDVLRLAAGDVVDADTRLLSGTRLQVDEALLTGESLPVDRAPEALVPEEGPLGDRAGMVQAGSRIVRGSGEAVVVATGADSAFGPSPAGTGRPGERCGLGVLTGDVGREVVTTGSE